MQKNLTTNTNPNGTAQQQNISINISYNLNTSKIPKSMLGVKKTNSKSKRIHNPGIQAIGNEFFTNLPFNPLGEAKKNIKKENLPKKSNQVTLSTKQPKNPNEKRTSIKKKKSKQSTLNQAQLLTQPDAVIQYYNPLANNAKHFLKRNIQSPDIFKAQNARKLKTQASSYEPMETTFKKKKTITNHRESHSGIFPKNTKVNNFVKETIPNNLQKFPSSIKTMLKKPIGHSKTPKNKSKASQQFKQKQKRIHTQQNELIASNNNVNVQYRHNKSCMLYSTKKQPILTQPHLIQTAENIMSTYASVNSTKAARKRAQSAFIFGRKDKQLVSKLLNMSIISSELGSSQLISSERMRSARNDITRKKLGLKVDQFDQFNHYFSQQPHGYEKATQEKKEVDEPSPGNALRQYLNSIDLRIIKNIESDTANIIKQQFDTQTNNWNNPNQSQPTIKPHQMLFVRKRSKDEHLNQNTIVSQQTDVVSFYNKLFSNALNNKRIQDQQEKYIDSANHSLTSYHQNLSVDINGDAKVKKEMFQIESDGKDSAIEFDLTEQYNNKQRLVEKSEQSKIQLYEFTKQSKQKAEKSDGSIKLNFKHYKELLNKQAEKEKKEKESFLNFDFQLMSCQPQLVDKDIQKDSLTKIQSCEHQQDQKSSHSIKQAKQIVEMLYFQQNNDQKEKLLVYKEEEIQRWNTKNVNVFGMKQLSQSDSLRMKKYVGELNDDEDDLLLIASIKEVQNRVEKQKTHENQPKLVAETNKQPKSKPAIIQPYAETKKSPKSKPAIFEPEYKQISWQYNPQEIQKFQSFTRTNNISQNHAQVSGTQKNVYNSPNNCSEDGAVSADEQYDSKKYESDVRDGVIEIQQKLGNLEKQRNEKGSLNHDVSSDSLQNGEYEEREINCNERWVNPHFSKTVEDLSQQSMTNQEKSPKSAHQKKQQSYLECSLMSFGVKNYVQTQNSSLKQQQKQNRKKDKKQLNLVKDQQNLKQINQIIDSVGEGKDGNNTLKLTINGRQTKEKLLLDDGNEKTDESTQNVGQKKDVFSQIRRKRLTHIVEDIILELIRQFARDISYILKKSSHEKKMQQEIEENTSPFRSYKQGAQEGELSPYSKGDDTFEIVQPQGSQRQQQIKKSQFVGKCFGIDTSYSSVQRYLREFKQYILRDEALKQAIIKNINKDIGPNSLQILSYLRPQYECQQGMMNEMQYESQENNRQDRGEQEQSCDEEDGLFVVPSQAFTQFENYLQQKIEQGNKRLQPEKQVIMTQKQKRNTNFWHRGIYESWNEFLDFQRPYGINGKPYEWINERKKFREVRILDMEKKLQRGIDKLMEAISLPSGIIYDKFDLPLMYSDLTEEQKIYLNEERLSRMLAIQLFQSEETWINYNDEMAELLVELSRVIEDRIFFQMTTQMKKVMRKRNLLVAQENNNSSVDIKTGDIFSDMRFLINEGNQQQ